MKLLTLALFVPYFLSATNLTHHIEVPFVSAHEVAAKETEFKKRNPAFQNSAAEVKFQKDSGHIMAAKKGVGSGPKTLPKDMPNILKAFIVKNQDLLGLDNKTLNGLQYKLFGKGSFGNIDAVSSTNTPYSSDPKIPNFSYKTFYRAEVEDGEVTDLVYLDIANRRLPVSPLYETLDSTQTVKANDKVILDALIGRDMYSLFRGPKKYLGKVTAGNLSKPSFVVYVRTDYKNKKFLIDVCWKFKISISKEYFEAYFSPKDGSLIDLIEPAVATLD